MTPKTAKRAPILLLLCLGWVGAWMPDTAWARPKDRKPTAVVTDYVQAARTALEQNDPVSARTAVEQYFHENVDKDSVSGRRNFYALASRVLFEELGKSIRKTARNGIHDAIAFHRGLLRNLGDCQIGY